MTIEEQIEGAVRRVVREEFARLGSLGAGLDDVLTYEQAALDVKVDKSLIGRWVRDGLLPAHGRGKAKRVYRRDVRRALELSSKPKMEPTAQEIADNILAPKKLRRVR